MKKSKPWSVLLFSSALISQDQPATIIVCPDASPTSAALSSIKL